MRKVFFLIFRETIGDLFFGFTLYCREYFGFTFSVGDALRRVISVWGAIGSQTKQSDSQYE